MLYSDLNLFIRDESTINYRSYASSLVRKSKVTKSKNPLLIKQVNSIKQSVILILSTQKGSRIFIPDFGCDLLQYLYKPIDFITTDSIENEIFTALTYWERRIRIVNLTVKPDKVNSQYFVLLEYDIPTLMYNDSLSFNLKTFNQS